jgi:hypothetical protein
MLPTFNIIKCTVDRADLRSTTVIQSLHKQAGYTAADGWTLKIWERELALKIKGVEKTMRYSRPYLVHVDGTVITTQHKAWMDSVGMCMWVDLVMGPWAKASGRKKILVWDSCGPHKVAAVKAVFDEWGIAIEALPVNMTDVLQVMDLVVNGPLKAHMRRFRCAALFSYFQSWKVKWLQELLKPAGTRIMPAFTPPKPVLIDGLNMLRAVSAEVFAKDEFKQGLVRAFVKVGLAVSIGTGTFYNYTSHSRGSMPTILAPTDSPSDEQFTLGNVAAELELEPRRANLLGAFDDVTDGFVDEADGQDEPADDGAAA